jgi:predicted dehydrogenase
MIQRVLIVGSGSAGKRHLAIARRFLPRADIRVLRRHRANEGFPLSNGCFHLIEQALRFSPQIAVIANPAPFHLKTANKLTSSGCHLLIEKPISHQSTGVSRLIKKTAKNKKILQVGYNLRYLLSLQKFRNLIQAGKIGRTLSVHATVGQYLPTWRPNKDYRETVSARSELGGGVFLELSHEIDYLRWIFGELGWVSAWKGKIGNLNLNVDDSAKLQMGTLKKRESPEVVITLNMDFVRQDPVRCCEAIGTKGTLRWDGLKGKVDAFFAGRSEVVNVYSAKETFEKSYTDQFKSFILCVQLGKKPLVSGLDGLAVLKIIEAATQSHEKNGSRIHFHRKK